MGLLKPTSENRVPGNDQDIYCIVAKMNGDAKRDDGMVTAKLGPILVSGSRDKTIKFFDVNAGLCLFTLVSVSL